MNEEDGQADVKQDHHADEDGVRDLGAVERSCLSPRGLRNTLALARITTGWAQGQELQEEPS